MLNSVTEAAIFLIEQNVVFNQVSVPNEKLDFGVSVVGETTKQSFTLLNKGSLGCAFEMKRLQSPSTAGSRTTKDGMNL